MNRGFLVMVAALVMLVMGCEHAQTIENGGCGDATVETDALDVKDDAGTGNVVLPPDDQPAPLADGAPCDENAQCENAVCMPSKNSFGLGYCFSSAMDGCIVVGSPSPMKDLCASLSRRLYTCGNDTDVSVWDLGCVDVGTGSFGEHYHCCNKPLVYHRHYE